MQALNWLTGGGAMADAIANHDWSHTSLGAIETWPVSLRTTVSLCLASNFPINIIWGPDRLQIYNDGYRVVCGAAHPRALGEPYTVTWASAWPAIGQPFENALEGRTSFLENVRMFLERNGYPEETFFTFSLSPIRDERGTVVGLFHPVTETTGAMLSQRRTRALRDLADRTANAKSVTEAGTLALEVLANYPLDLPMVALYLADAGGSGDTLVGTVGVAEGSSAAPAHLAIAADHVAPERGHGLTHLSEFRKTVGDVVCGEYPEPLRDAVLVTLLSGSGQRLGVLRIGTSPRLPLDEGYRTFLKMAGDAVGTAFNNARSFEEERRRAEALAEVDRAKTAFFSNVSHEFRTPLTLMLGPLEDLLAGNRGELSAAVRTETEVVQRNALRLLKLVNALLDFSRLEANRVDARYRATDLSRATRDLVGAFRSAVERAGLKLTVDVAPLGEPVFVDRDMWEKIVLNLLSNALKYTLAGGISVSLRKVGREVELAVRDTGVGISAAELPRVFERFHRIEGTGGRTHEGTGIGLALVQELTRLHQGRVSVESESGVGSTFRVHLRLGREHVPEHRLAMDGTGDGEAEGALTEAFVEEASQWSAHPELEPAANQVSPGEETELERRTVLLADDNADMRAYLTRLLEREFNVLPVVNGREALEVLRARRVDLLLTDVMMPVMDGIELLGAVRKDPKLRTVPVVLLSARAGEEAKASGIELGADDYLVKPFSAKELTARIRTQLKMAGIRSSALAQAIRTESLARTLRARDEFLSIASHELKTPITSLKMQLEHTQRSIDVATGKVPSAEKLSKVFAVSGRQVDRLTRLVEDLLDVSRLHSGRMQYSPEPVDLVGLAREVVDRMHDQLRGVGCEVRVDAGDAVVVECDRFRVEQVLTNLLSNTIKYAAGKPVEVSVRDAPGGGVLEVRDHGMGIPVEHQGRIFDRFERAISFVNVSGLGLGLYISKEIVEAHGGKIQLESVESRGATFTVELPRRFGRNEPQGLPSWSGRSL